MDFISAFKSELFRPLVTLFIPGAVASGPYLLLIGHYGVNARKFWEEHPSTTVAVVLGCIIAVGLVLENWGSRLEVLWDGVLNKDGSHNATWDEYLGLRLKDEIVGQRYLRTLLLRMKFELAMVPGLAGGGAGLLWLNAVRPFWPFSTKVLIAIWLILLVYFVWESYDSAKTMGKTRAVVVRAARAGRVTHFE